MHVDENIDWKRSFSSLGCAFTIRILLRRELFGELEKWLESDGDLRGEDPQTIIDDVEATLRSLASDIASASDNASAGAEDASTIESDASTMESGAPGSQYEGQLKLKRCLKLMRERHPS